MPHPDNPGLKVLVYGDPKTGKTYFTLTFPPPILILNLDMGAEPGLRKAHAAGIDVVWFNFFDPNPDSPEGYRALDDFLVKTRASGKVTYPDGETRPLDDFNTISLDSLSSFIDISLHRCKQVDSKSGIMGAPALHHYLGASQLLKTVTTKLLTLPHNIVFTAHQQVDKDEVLGNIFGSPALVGKASAQYARNVSDVYHTESVLGDKHSHRLLRTTSHPIWQAGSGWGGDDIPDLVPNDFRLIYEYVMKRKPFWECPFDLPKE